jgi:hypothetical protein
MTSRERVLKAFGKLPGRPDLYHCSLIYAGH